MVGKGHAIGGDDALHGHAVVQRLVHQLGTVAEKCAGLTAVCGGIQLADVLQQRIFAAGDALGHSDAPLLQRIFFII